MIGANAQRGDGAQISAKLKSVTPSAAPERPQSQAALSLAAVNLPVPATRTGSAESSRALARISGISIQDGIEGETIVDVSTTRPTTYRVLRLRNPERLVVDMEEARNATRQKGYPAHSTLLKGVRVGQFRDNPATVRVVADLLADPAFDVHAYDGGVRIELRARQLAANPESSATSSALSEGSLASPKPEVKRIQLASANVSLRTSARAEQEAASAPASSKTDSPPPPPQAETPTSVPTVPNAVEPQKTQPPAPASTDVNAPPTPPPPPPQAPESLQTGKVTKVLSGSTATQEKPKYTGEPISLNLKDVDLKDFFRLVHEISGLNIIVDPNVAGSVTMVLDAVPWDQALDIVLKNNRLDKLLEGNVLRIARIETLSSEQEASAKLLAARDEAQPLVTVFQPINYAKAATIATILTPGVGAVRFRSAVPFWLTSALIRSSFRISSRKSRSFKRSSASWTRRRNRS
jgi:type IV pilus assembly protein PilQ